MSSQPAGSDEDMQAFSEEGYDESSQLDWDRKLDQWARSTGECAVPEFMADTHGCFFGGQSKKRKGPPPMMPIAEDGMGKSGGSVLAAQHHASGGSEGLRVEDGDATAVGQGVSLHGPESGACTPSILDHVSEASVDTFGIANDDFQDSCEFVSETQAPQGSSLVIPGVLYEGPVHPTIAPEPTGVQMGQISVPLEASPAKVCHCCKSTSQDAVALDRSH
jgi:hypothetical protein